LHHYILAQLSGALAGGKIAIVIAGAEFTAGFPAKHPESSNKTKNAVQRLVSR